MKPIIEVDAIASEMQTQLKEHLVNLIMNENTIIKSVDYAENSVAIEYLTGTVKLV